MSWFIPALVFFTVLVIVDLVRNMMAKNQIEEEFLENGDEYTPAAREYMLYKMSEHNANVTNAWVTVVFLTILAGYYYMS